MKICAIENELEYGVPYGEYSLNADMEYINSEKYANKFKNITDHETVNQTLLECSRAAITHRNGTLYEDMYLINGNTGKIIAHQLNALQEQRINYSNDMLKCIENARKNNIPIIAFHSHPEGYPPSIDDFNSLYEHGYSFGIVAGHNGQIYKYQNNRVYIEDCDEVQLNIALAYEGGVDIDRAYLEAFSVYGLSYEIVKE